jgi:hypothetical protein
MDTISIIDKNTIIDIFIGNKIYYINYSNHDIDIDYYLNLLKVNNPMLWFNNNGEYIISYKGNI